MGRSPCCDMVGLKKGPWTPEEDHKLMSYIQQHGHGSWRALPPKAGLKRCGKSCRLRWTNYLRPDIKRGEFSLQEEQTIVQLHALLGNRWSTIASHLPSRTDNEVKNYWNTHIKKRLTKMGIDPITHKPKNHTLIAPGQHKDIANLSHMAQWESTRLEAEARIVRESKSLSSSNSLINKSTTVVPAPAPRPPRLLPSRPPCLDILKAWQATKPRKDILTAIVNGGSLKSPTSILNFSDNMWITSASPTVGWVSSMDKNYGAHLDACIDVYRGKDIMGKSLQVQDNELELVRNSGDGDGDGDDDDGGGAGCDSLRYPLFLEGFVDLPPLPDSSMVCMTTSNHENIAYEDNNKISYWSNILNALITSDDF